jgi:ADP-heptose:LPS heptosyltransferase
MIPPANPTAGEGPVPGSGAPVRVLAILHGLIGDTLMRVPALRALRDARPDMELLAIADPVSAPVLAINPLFDRVLAWDRRGSGLRWQLRQLRKLRSWAPDVALDFYFGGRTPWIARLSGAPRRIGPARTSAARRLLTDPLPYPLPADVHMIDRFADLVRPLGAGAVRREWEFPVHEAVRERMLRLVEAPGVQDVVLAVGAGDESKRLADDRMLEFARGLTEAGHRVLLVRDWRDPELGEELLRVSGVEALPPLGLPELGALFGAVGLVAVGDTGLLHVALGSARRVVTWYQSTDPVVHRAERQGYRSHYREVCPLQPCDTREKHRCRLECTWSIPVEELLDSVAGLFGAPGWIPPALPARDPETLPRESL